MNERKNDPFGHQYVFVLRVWIEPRQYENQPKIWRFSLERIPDGRRMGFATIAAISQFLQRMIACETAQKKDEMTFDKEEEDG